MPSRPLLRHPALAVAVCRAESRDRILPLYGAHQAGCRSTSFRARGHEARKEQRSTNRDRRSARHERTLTPTVDVPVPHRRLLPPSTPPPLRPPPLLCTCTALSKAVKSSCTMFATSIGRMLCRNQHIFASACKSCAISVQFCRAYGHHGRSFALRHRIMFKEREFRAGTIASPRRFIRTHSMVATQVSKKVDFQLMVRLGCRVPETCSKTISIRRFFLNRNLHRDFQCSHSQLSFLQNKGVSRLGHDGELADVELQHHRRVALARQPPVPAGPGRGRIRRTSQVESGGDRPHVLTQAE